MIHKPLMLMLRAEIPSLIWSVNNFTAASETGTVYDESGAKPSTYDDEMRHPQYTVFIRSNNFDKAQEAAQKVFGLLHRKQNFDVTVTGSDKIVRTYRVYFMEALQDPIRIGITDNVMEYSINFECALRRINPN